MPRSPRADHVLNDRPNSRLLTQTSCLAFLLFGLIAINNVSAQAPFNPPPPPQPIDATAQASYAPLSPDTPPAQVGPVVSPPASAAIGPAPPVSSPTTPTGAQPLEGGEIVARVDGQIILASDVLWQVDQLIAANRDRIPDDKVDVARRALMRQQVMGLIDTKMIYANFRRQVPAENIPTIMDNLREPFEEQEIPRLIKMLKLNSRSELDALLRKSGTSIADVRRQFNERTIAGEWLRQMMDKPKEITHEDMLTYYEEHKQEYEFPAQAKWEEVMINFSRMNGDRNAAWKAITGIGNEVWQRVSRNPGLRGAVFTEIATEKSHGFTAASGGGHDWTTKGALRSKDIDNALFTLKVGQLSNVIESDLGFHIIRVLERKEAGRTPFREAQSEIRQALTKDQRKGLAEEQVVKLRKKSRVWTVFDGAMSGEEIARKNSSLQR